MEPRNYLANAGATPPAAPASPSNGYPQSAVPGVSEATIPGAHWFYKIGESLRRIITGSGQTPDDADMAMLEVGVRRYAGAQTNGYAAGDSPVSLTVADAGTVILDASAGALVVNLPAASTLDGLAYDLVRHPSDASGNTITINRSGTDTIGGATSTTVNKRQRLKSDGVSGWLRTAGDDATQAEAEAGTSNEKAMTPLRTKQAIDGALRAVQVFTASATWTKPAGLKRVKVTVVGGGGGGHGQTDGGAGGTSSFGSHCSATGGAGGTTSAAPALGGIGAGGDMNARGSSGGCATGSTGEGGVGGSSTLGGGGTITQAGGKYGGGGGPGAWDKAQGGCGGGTAFKIIEAAAVGDTNLVSVGVGGTAGTGAYAGASGIVIVEEYF